MNVHEFVGMLKQVFTKEQLKRLTESQLQNLPNNGGKPQRQRIFNLNKAMQNERRLDGVPGDWGYVALNIPPDDMRVIQLRYPDTASSDAKIQHNAWVKFIASPESEKYKVRKRDGKRGVLHRGIIVK
jgi:hypothetical protein